MTDAQKRTWAEVDLSRLENNYHALRSLLPAGCRFLGVVKANAYGHGAIPVAKRLEKLGAEYLAVACLDEAIQLREAGITAPILILGVTPGELADKLLDYGLTQTVEGVRVALALSDAATRRGQLLKIHIKADTGMSRLGFLCNEAHRECSVEEIARVCSLPGLQAEGIFTHFADADGSEEYTMLQLSRFLDLLEGLAARGITFLIRHCAASAAVLNYPCTHLDMVRPGIALYGHYPAPDMEDTCPLEPVLSLKTRVAAVRELPAGTKVSYGCTHTLSRDSRLAVLPVGYADGFFRCFSNRLEVEAGGKKAPLVGRVCMDLCMVDVTDIPTVKAGDIVTLYGDNTPVESGAELVGSISYELLCDISARVPRIYSE